MLNKQENSNDFIYFATIMFVSNTTNVDLNKHIPMIATEIHSLMLISISKKSKIEISFVKTQYLTTLQRKKMVA